jgi:hypothetical protein
MNSRISLQFHEFFDLGRIGKCGLLHKKISDTERPINFDGDWCSPFSFLTSFSSGDSETILFSQLLVSLRAELFKH